MPALGFTPTPEQLEAIRLADRSVLVSAAAGSGKTAVLAERCAYLVCDAPNGERCSVDELLVLTFTEAAAAEMRSRIIDSIRARVAARPYDPRLREQLALSDAAQISTIHAFCLWLIRRWFSEIGIDPTAEVMDGEESALLKQQVLEELFAARYAIARDPDDPLGIAEIEAAAGGKSIADSATAAPQSDEIAKAQEFCRLIDDYGLGQDRDIATAVLKINEFTNSLPDPACWLREAVEQLADGSTIQAAVINAFTVELSHQAKHCRAVAASMAADGDIAKHYAKQIADYSDVVAAWLKDMLAAPDVRVFERIRQEVEAFAFDSKRAPRLDKNADERTRANRDAASETLSRVKKKLLEERLKNRFALFSVDEMIADLRRTAPYAATLADLVTAFGESYSARKRRLNVLDFSDLERFAYQLLSTAGEGDPVVSLAAASLRRKFAHILIDESQDVNPLQEAIVRLSSRESDTMRRDNLFSVGDVKQSIYRFRLAEPGLFTARLLAFGDGRESKPPSVTPTSGQLKSQLKRPGQAIYLQKNFRSRPEILEAVNTVFRPLMSLEFGGVPYDDHAELRTGRAEDHPPQPIELHLLERNWESSESAEEDAESGGSPADNSESDIAYADLSDPAQWTAIEREACLIGRRIRCWLDEVTGDGIQTRQLRDIAVLLRATRVNAERTAAVLNAMGIPAFAQVGGSLFGAREIRDVLAALRVLDNPEQDIPLVGVLRSGIFGLRLDVDELAEIRLLDRTAPYHAMVKEYAVRGLDPGLRERVAQWLLTVDRIRDRARRRPLSETVWALYEDGGYLAYAAGLANGSQRRANLLKLHDLARKFGGFRRQGLHRFLQFLASLQAEEHDLDVAPLIGESENVVRIMSIHQSKGLEFPLVFLAGMGAQFNLGDRNGRIIFERRSRIGMRVVDPAKMIEYPSAAHALVAAEIERTAREEELRILYVAMTRARDKLVMIGSGRDMERWGEVASGRATPGTRLTPLTIACANTPLDWLLPIVTADRRTQVASLESCDASASSRSAPLFALHLHTSDEMAGWRVAGDAQGGAELRRAVARLEPLPAGEPMPQDDSLAQQIVDRAGYEYPHLPATAMPAALGARALAEAASATGSYDPLSAAILGEARVFGPAQRRFEYPRSKYVEVPRGDPAWRGVVTHRVLQHLDFTACVGLDWSPAERTSRLASELSRLAAAGLLSPDDIALIDREALSWFLATPLSERIRAGWPGYFRETRFLSTETIDRVDPSLPPSEDRVLIRGMIDAVLETSAGLELIDFKTDAISADEVAARARDYEPQLRLYAAAAEKLWRMPVIESRLVFLTPREIVSMAQA